MEKVSLKKWPLATYGHDHPPEDCTLGLTCNEFGYNEPDFCAQKLLTSKSDYIKQFLLHLLTCCKLEPHHPVSGAHKWCSDTESKPNMFDYCFCTSSLKITCFSADANAIDFRANPEYWYINESHAQELIMQERTFWFDTMSVRKWSRRASLDMHSVDSFLPI